MSIDPEKCSGCRLCEIACSIKHHGTSNTDFSRIRILHLTPSEKNIPLVCMACDDAPCIKVCPMNARLRETNGAVVTDQERCIGCRACIYICPIGSPSVNPNTHKTMTCDMCKGETSPWCVTACRFEGALKMVDAETSYKEKARKQAERITPAIARSRARS